MERLGELSKNGHERELRVYLNELLPEAQLDMLAAPTAAAPEKEKLAIYPPAQQSDESQNLFSTAQP